MFQSFWIGRYVPGDRFLHRMNPLCKLIVTGMFAFLIAVAESVGMMAVHAIVASTAVFMARIPLFVIWHSLKGILLIALAAASFRLFDLAVGEAVVSVGIIAVSEDGVKQAVLVFSRLVLLIVSVLLLTMTTTSSDLAYGMAAMLFPLRVFGIPTERFAFTLVIALRFLPVFLQELDQLAMAYRARLGGFRRSGLIALLAQSASLFILAFAHLYRRVEDLAVGLEARGYRTDAARVGRRAYRFGWRDAAASLVVVAQYVPVFFHLHL